MRDSGRLREAAVPRGVNGLGPGSGQWFRSAMERLKWLLRLVVSSLLFLSFLFFFCTFKSQIATSNRALTKSKKGKMVKILSYYCSGSPMPYRYIHTPYNDDTVIQLPKTATFDVVSQAVLTVHRLGIIYM